LDIVILGLLGYPEVGMGFFSLACVLTSVPGWVLRFGDSPLARCSAPLEPRRWLIDMLVVDKLVF
jgi:hypothetical protein